MTMSDDEAGHFGSDESLSGANGSFREKPDGEADPAGEAGWFLHGEREQRGESVEDASQATGVHPYHIEAVEFGDMTQMPERLEALEMIGVYAQYLGFDPEPLVRHYAHFLPRPQVVSEASHPANPAPLTSAKVLRFVRFPKMPQFSFRLSGIPGGAGRLLASLPAAIFLFAGASWGSMPGNSQPQ